MTDEGRATTPRCPACDAAVNVGKLVFLSRGTRCPSCRAPLQFGRLEVTDGYLLMVAVEAAFITLPLLLALHGIDTGRAGEVLAGGALVAVGVVASLPALYAICARRIRRDGLRRRRRRASPAATVRLSVAVATGAALTAVGAIVGAAGLAGSEPEAPTATPLTVGGTSHVAVGRGGADFVVDVPEDAWLIAIDATPTTRVDLDLWAEFGSLPVQGSRCDVAAVGPGSPEHVVMTRDRTDGFATGPLYVRLKGQRPVTLGGGNVGVEADVQVAVVRRGAADDVPFDEVTGRVLRSDRGSRDDVVVDVPDDVDNVRIALADAPLDLDIFADPAPIGTASGALWQAQGLRREETRVVPRPSAGKLYITIRSKAWIDGEFGYTLRISDAAKGLPSPICLPPVGEQDRRERAVVEVFAVEGRGSGFLVSPDGLILTAEHVVRSALDYRSPPWVHVGVALGSGALPRTAFRAKIVAWRRDTDVALLQITSGADEEGLEVPLAFPFLELAPAPLDRGATVTILGFPDVRGLAQRVISTATVSCGTIDLGHGPRTRLRGSVRGGASGGPVLDESGRAAAMVQQSRDENSAWGDTFALPVDALPPDWRATIDGPR